MEKVVRNVAEHQQVVISVVNLDLASPAASHVSASGETPAWWNVSEGLSDEEVDRLGQAVRQRSNLIRTTG